MTKQQDTPIYKSNALVEASYRLTPAEQRIMLACIAQVRRDQEVTDRVPYSVSAADIAAMSGSTSKAAYEELEKAALRLKRREVWIKEYPNGEGSRPETLVTGWVQSIRYKKAEGRVELRFSTDMLPYLTQLSAQFTKYALDDVARMTSAYAIRLYELFAQWRGTGEREVSIDWLRDAFQLDGKYPLFYEFKRWVVEPAVQQINEHSPLAVVWEQRKTGRKVTHIHFKFAPKAKEKPAAVLAEKPQKPRKPKSESAGPQAATGYLAFVLSQLKMTEAEFDAAARPGEDYKQAFARLKRERRGVTAD